MRIKKEEKQWNWIKPGTDCTCPVCGKQFKSDIDTNYIIKKDYTCSWKCFSDYVKTHIKQEYLETQQTKKRGRPKKDVSK